MSATDKFTQALMAALPEGDAWTKHPGSVQVAVVRGFAAAFAALDEHTADAPVQWLPQSTVTRLGEWERAVGLPDGTSRDVASYESRRADVLARLRGVDLAYDDSSPAALAAIEDELERAGFTADLSYCLPARVSTARCGDRLGGELCVLWVSVPGAVFTPARIGAVCGNRLGTFNIDAKRLQALLERIIPARFEYRVAQTITTA